MVLISLGIEFKEERRIKSIESNSIVLDFQNVAKILVF